MGARPAPSPEPHSNPCRRPPQLTALRASLPSPLSFRHLLARCFLREMLLRFKAFRIAGPRTADAVSCSLSVTLHDRQTDRQISFSPHLPSCSGLQRTGRRLPTRWGVDGRWRGTICSFPSMDSNITLTQKHNQKGCLTKYPATSWLGQADTK